MPRPDKDWVMLGMAMLLASRAMCQRRQVGCILTDRHGVEIASAYNGRIAGLPNCEGADSCEGFCEGMHAEINALLRKRGRPHTAYVTCMPCVHCAKALIAAGVDRLVIGTGELDAEQRQAQALWQQFGYEILEVNCAGLAGLR